MSIVNTILEKVKSIKEKFNIHEFELYFDDFFDIYFIKIINTDFILNDELENISDIFTNDLLLQFPEYSIFLTWEDDCIELSGDFMNTYYWNLLNSNFEIINYTVYFKDSKVEFEPINNDIEYSFLKMDAIESLSFLKDNYELISFETNRNYKTAIPNKKSSDYYNKNSNLESDFEPFTKRVA